MYSQNEEESYILNYFGSTVGNFLDIGAFDGVVTSNTLALVERGWSGVLVEPAPCHFAKLIQKHHANPKLTLVNCALGSQSEFLNFHYTEYGGVSTFKDERRDAWTHAAEFWDFQVHVVGMPQFLAAFPGPYDFIDIDTEGMDAILLDRIPLDDTRMVCIEYVFQVDQITTRMASAGFNLIYRNLENFLFAR